LESFSYDVEILLFSLDSEGVDGDRTGIVLHPDSGLTFVARSPSGSVCPSLGGALTASSSNIRKSWSSYAVSCICSPEFLVFFLEFLVFFLEFLLLLNEFVSPVGLFLNKVVEFSFVCFVRCLLFFFLFLLIFLLSLDEGKDKFLKLSDLLLYVGPGLVFA
jgi:hypothetical protein